MTIKFGPAGLGPVKDAEKVLEQYKKFGFKICEIAFTYSVYIKKEDAKRIGEKAKELGREISEETRLIIEEIKKGTSAVVTEIKEGGILVSRTGEVLIDRTREEFSEAAITATIKAKYAKSPKVSAVHINITTDKGNVILSGTAHCKEEIVEAINLAMSVEGVKNVTSLLEMRE